MNYLRSSDFLDSEDFPFNIEPFTIKRNEIIKPHSHDFVELVYIINGNGYHFFEEEVYSLKEGDMFIIEPNKVHAYEAKKDSNIEVYNILFQPSLLQSSEIKLIPNVKSYFTFLYGDYLLEKSKIFQPHIFLNHQEKDELSYLLHKMNQESENRELGYQIIIRTKMVELFILLSRFYEKRITSSIPEHKQDDEIDYICKYIKCNYRDSLTLDQISKLAGMSKSSFSFKFKQAIGKTFIEYRDEIRIHTSKELLATTNEKIIHIANEIGFNDIGQFNKIFKKFTNLTPSMYRKLYRVYA